MGEGPLAAHRDGLKQFIPDCPLIGCTTGVRRHQIRRLTIDVSEDDLREIARRGYEDAATTDRKRQAEAVSLFVSDTLHG
jgi:hypothetical protein